MASKLVKSNKMKRMESKKSHSWWWDSHISPKNSKWLQDNLEEMDQKVKLMLKLMEDDADSFTKKVEMYYQKRPEMIHLVEEFYRMYRALTEHYDHVTGELRKNDQSGLQSQVSEISNVGPESPSSFPSPDRNQGRPMSDINKGDNSPTSVSESESDDSSLHNSSATQSIDEEQDLRKRIIELEAELSDVKEKLETQQREISDGSLMKPGDENSEFSTKIAAYQEDLRIAEEKIRSFEEENRRLLTELEKYKSVEDGEVEQHQISELQESIDESKSELKITQEKLNESEKEVASLRDELERKGSSIQDLEDQLKSAQNEISIWIIKLQNEKSEVSKLQAQIEMHKSNLADRDQEIVRMKEEISNASKSLSTENKQLQSDLIIVSNERADLENKLKELNSCCQSLEENVRRVEAGKAETEAMLEAQIEQLKAEVYKKQDDLQELNKILEDLKLNYTTLRSEKDGQIDQMKNHLHQLHLEHVELVVAAEGARELADKLRTRVKELETVVEKKEEAIREAAEEKREAIRQLCLSLEHYRNGYQTLRQAVINLKRVPVMAS